MELRSNGSEIRRRRVLKGLSLTEFAQMTGYTLNHASQVELGNNKAGPAFLRKAAHLFECEVSDLLMEQRPQGRRGAAA
ncbi:helix-turn-helix transcriptional regulator [Streptomyces sp. NPDC006997]|uniref:helix-turn-helix domain-containing protein n=1 Tax=Streptomyces sp. NPDC006997 TaxID=3155356 RepID=UPI0033CBC222